MFTSKSAIGPIFPTIKLYISYVNISGVRFNPIDPQFSSPSRIAESGKGGSTEGIYSVYRYSTNL